MDLRIEHIFREEMKEDTSFQEKESGLSLLFGTTKYSKVEMRETWDRGIKHGIKIALRENQVIDHSQINGATVFFLNAP